MTEVYTYNQQPKKDAEKPVICGYILKNYLILSCRQVDQNGDGMFGDFLYGHSVGICFLPTGNLARLQGGLESGT